jgi:hypothetical protein
MINIKIDRTKIDRKAVYIGKKGEYYTFTLMDNKSGRDEYGQDGFVVLDIGKERRMAGEKGPIVGNWNHVGPPPSASQRDTRQNGAPPPSTTATADALDEEGFEDVPF